MKILAENKNLLICKSDFVSGSWLMIACFGGQLKILGARGTTADLR